VSCAGTRMEDVAGAQRAAGAGGVAAVAVRAVAATEAVAQEVVVKVEAPLAVAVMGEWVRVAVEVAEQVAG